MPGSCHPPGGCSGTGREAWKGRRADCRRSGRFGGHAGCRAAAGICRTHQWGAAACGGERGKTPSRRYCHRRRGEPRTDRGWIPPENRQRPAADLRRRGQRDDLRRCDPSGTVPRCGLLREQRLSADRACAGDDSRDEPCRESGLPVPAESVLCDEGALLPRLVPLRGARGDLCRRLLGPYLRPHSAVGRLRKEPSRILRLHQRTAASGQGEPVVSDQSRTLRGGLHEDRLHLPGQSRDEHDLGEPERRQLHQLHVPSVPGSRRARGGGSVGESDPFPEPPGRPFPRQGVLDAGLPLYNASAQARQAAPECQHHALRHRLQTGGSADGQRFGTRFRAGAGGVVGHQRQPLRLGLRHQLRQHALAVPQLPDPAEEHPVVPKEPRHDALLTDRR